MRGIDPVADNGNFQATYDYIKHRVESLTKRTKEADKELIDNQITKLFEEYPDHETEINELLSSFEEKAGINEEFILNSDEDSEDNKKDLSEQVKQITDKTPAITVLYLLKEIKQSDIAEKEKRQLEKDIYINAEKSLKDLEFERTKSRINANKASERVVDAPHKDTDLFPLKDFPNEALPVQLKEMCADLSEVFQVDREAIYHLMLPVISGSIGNAIEVKSKKEWIQPVFLLHVLCEYSGRGKSPIQSFFMRHIKNKQNIEIEKSKKDLKQWKVDCRIAKNNDEPELDKPICKRYCVNNCTVEALVKIMEDNQKGLIIDIDEFSGHVKAHNMYRNGNDKEFWLTTFNNDSFVADRKTTEIVGCKKTGIAVIAGIQPGELKRLFSSEDHYDTGYVARYNFYIHSDKVKKYTTENIEIRHKETWKKFIDYCHEMEVENVDGDIVPHRIHFSKEALEVLIDYCNSLESNYRYLTDNGKTFLGKSQLYFARFAGIFHVLDSYFEDKNLHIDITQKTALNAKKLCEFYLGQAMKMLSLYEEKEELSGLDKKLIEALRTIESEVKSGKVLLSRVVEEYNNGLPENAKITDNRVMSSLLKKQNIKVVSGTGNKRCLLWESEKIEKLYSKID